VNRVRRALSVENGLLEIAAAAVAGFLLGSIGSGELSFLWQALGLLFDI
jgi:hypothetical protein